MYVQKSTYLGNAKGKKSLITWNWDKIKYKLTSIKCDLSLQCGMEPV